MCKILNGRLRESVPVARRRDERNPLQKNELQSIQERERETVDIKLSPAPVFVSIEEEEEEEDKKTIVRGKNRRRSAT